MFVGDHVVLAQGPKEARRRRLGVATVAPFLCRTGEVVVLEQKHEYIS
jgi:hypothetical protein